MRFVVKKWGNGLAVRIPRNSAEIGRVEEGMELEGPLRPLRVYRHWKPVTFDSGEADSSQRIDEVVYAHLEEKYGPWPSSIRASSSPSPRKAIGSTHPRSRSRSSASDS